MVVPSMIFVELVLVEFSKMEIDNDLLGFSMALVLESTLFVELVLVDYVLVSLSSYVSWPWFSPRKKLSKYC